MLTNLLLIALGLVALILLMALFLNPPEALVKKYFNRGRGANGASDKSDTP